MEVTTFCLEQLIVWYVALDSLPSSSPYAHIYALAPNEKFRTFRIRGTPETAQLAESMIQEMILNQPLILSHEMLVPQVSDLFWFHIFVIMLSCYQNCLTKYFVNYRELVEESLERVGKQSGQSLEHRVPGYL